MRHRRQESRATGSKHCFKYSIFLRSSCKKPEPLWCICSACLFQTWHSRACFPTRATPCKPGWTISIPSVEKRDATVSKPLSSCCYFTAALGSFASHRRLSSGLCLDFVAHSAHVQHRYPTRWLLGHEEKHLSPRQCAVFITEAPRERGYTAALPHSYSSLSAVPCL